MADNVVANIIKGFSSRFRKKRKANVYGISWLHMRYLKNLPETSYNQIRFLGNTLTVFGRTGFLHALKEVFFEEIYKIDLPAKPYIIDCGAHIGLSVIYFKHHYPDAEILAFEPDEQNFELLQKNVKSFGYKGVVLKKEAVWHQDGNIAFSNEGSMASKIVVQGSYKIPASRLRSHLTKKVDLLKVDIEGAEYLVLKDISDVLHLVSNLFLEYHGNFNQNNELADIFAIIQKNGFSFYIKEAAPVYEHPFVHFRETRRHEYDVQLNIFCFRQ